MRQTGGEDFLKAAIGGVTLQIVRDWVVRFNADGPDVASVQAYVRYAMERPSRYQLLFDLPGVFAMDHIGPVQPVFRVIAEPVEQMARDNEPVPLNDPILATLLILSLAHGRIALAHTAPIRPDNSTASVGGFVQTSIEQLFRDRVTRRRPE